MHERCLMRRSLHNTLSSYSVSGAAIAPFKPSPGPRVTDVALPFHAFNLHSRVFGISQLQTRCYIIAVRTLKLQRPTNCGAVIKHSLRADSSQRCASFASRAPRTSCSSLHVRVPIASLSLVACALLALVQACPSYAGLGDVRAAAASSEFSCSKRFGCMQPIPLQNYIDFGGQSDLMLRLQHSGCSSDKTNRAHGSLVRGCAALPEFMSRVRARGCKLLVWSAACAAPTSSGAKRLSWCADPALTSFQLRALQQCTGASTPACSCRCWCCVSTRSWSPA